MGLREYCQKRNFEKTAEPKGRQKKSDQKNLQFVVQEHHARRLHYDFRLEVNGVLKSWAVPKGPSLDPCEKRLAVQVEDHPFDYITFEGTIPKGSYGAGTVTIWDHGTYIAEGASNPKESEQLMEKGLAKGHLNFILDGEKLKGAFSLVRMHGADDKNWLLIKKREELHAVLHHSMSTTIRPMLATLVDQPFDSKEWVFEIKWDGYRAIAEIGHEHVLLYSRNLKPFGRQFNPILEDLQKIKQDAFLDGELVVLDENGKPSFQLLQNYLMTKEGELVYYVFDLLYLNGEDICQKPLLERKALLQKLLPSTPHLRYCEHIPEEGIRFFESVVHEGLEGMIAKNASSTYQPGKRSRDWLKIKSHLRQEAIICGFTQPKGSREKFGALLLGVYQQGRLIYVGHAGTGFDHQLLTQVYQKLEPLIQDHSPFDSPYPKKYKEVTWVQPKLVCEIKFAEWTHDEIMRQAVFLGLRKDKNSLEVIKETPEEKSLILQNRKKRTKNVSHSSGELSHLEKIFWPKEGYTKEDLINYYREVAPLILPYLKKRPEVLKRYPDGIMGGSFYQKNVTQIPEWVPTVTIQHESGKVRYLMINDERDLLYVINLGCIDLNPFNCRVDSLENPDFVILDLDPEGVEFDQVIEVARAAHEVLQKLEIPSCCKTSGATGMHIYIPLHARYTFQEAVQFTNLIAHLVHQQLPDLTSLERKPSKRQKKIYLDYLQNSFGQTIVAPYAVRPKEGAPVSTPLKWSEVKKGLDPLDFNIKSVLKRFKKMGDLFKPVLGKGIDLRELLKKIE